MKELEAIPEDVELVVFDYHVISTIKPPELKRKLRPGLGNLLKSLKDKKTKLAIRGDFQSQDVALILGNCMGYFDMICSKSYDQSQLSKGDQHDLKNICGQLDVSPSKTVLVTDSINGVEKHLVDKEGIKVIKYGGGFYQKKAAHVLDGELVLIK